MRLAALAGLVVLASGPAALAQQSSADSQKAFATSAAPAPRGASAPCTDGSGSYVGCGYGYGYNSRTDAMRTPLSVRGAVTDTGALQPTNKLPGIPDGAVAKCKDGTYAMQPSSTETCFMHAGVDMWLRVPQSP